jgi:hypothetical protein
MKATKQQRKTFKRLYFRTDKTISYLKFRRHNIRRDNLMNVFFVSTPWSLYGVEINGHAHT